MGRNPRTRFVGMDVHQKTISIAIADDNPDGEVRLYGTTKNIRGAIDKDKKNINNFISKRPHALPMLISCASFNIDIM